MSLKQCTGPLSLAFPITDVAVHIMDISGLSAGPGDNWYKLWSKTSQNLILKNSDLTGISGKSICTLHFFSVRIQPTSHYLQRYKLF